MRYGNQPQVHLVENILGTFLAIIYSQLHGKKNKNKNKKK
jgi:hypothetical protein